MDGSSKMECMSLCAKGQAATALQHKEAQEQHKEAQGQHKKAQGQNKEAQR